MVSSATASDTCCWFSELEPSAAAAVTAELTPPVLRTSVGDVPLQEYRLGIGGRTWSILHTQVVLSHADEARFLAGKDRLPYGVVLWPAAIALGHDVASRGAALQGRRVLELGAGTGLPGIIAASFGARVVQTDRHEVPLVVSRGNAARNGITSIEHRAADWAAWTDRTRYDWILGSDILYAESMHDRLRDIFTANLAEGGRVLLSDPFRERSMPLLERLEAEGWRIAVSKWNLGAETMPRPVGVFELTRP